MLSLEKLCLGSIVSKFELLYFAFTVSKNDNVKKHFEFLRRRFTQQLVTELFENRKLEDKFFEFLINEHLRYLDGAWFQNSHYLQSNTIEEIFRRVPNLERICFNNCGDEILENIAKFCPKIVEIDVSYSNVTDAGVKYLCESQSGVLPCPEVKSISLMPSCVTVKSAECLIRNLPQLERLDYPNIPLLLYRIHRANFSERKEIHCYNLVHLTISDFNNPTSNADLLVTCLSLCPKLKSLDCWITEEEDLNLFINTHLEKVCFKFVTDVKISVIKSFFKFNGCNLTSVTVTSCTIHVPSLAAYCPVLREISAHYVNLTNDGENQLILPSLTKFTFEQLNPSCAKSLALLIVSSPKLECITIANCASSLDWKSPIFSWCKTPSARKIHFIALMLNIVYVARILSNAPSLEEMIFSRCFIEDVNHNPEVALKSIAEKLPNKPKITFF